MSRIESRADLLKYLGHFNNKEYEQQIAYYAPDVVYKVGSLTLTSPQQIADFYADFHQYVKEHVELVDCAIDGDTVAVALHAIFEPFRDYVRNGLTFTVGTTTDIMSFVFYRLQNGKIRRIRMTRYGGTIADFAS
ncbi:MAG TPA: nuclear transport factor 2 family protein [Steroidobacteraceae bacterium]|nr:nuclear transport factor 2 family protein [Steroidobacteraceae bacterium]